MRKKTYLNMMINVSSNLNFFFFFLTMTKVKYNSRDKQESGFM